jgi:hypothetical protein
MAVQSADMDEAEDNVIYLLYCLQDLQGDHDGEHYYSLKANSSFG